MFLEQTFAVVRSLPWLLIVVGSIAGWLIKNYFNKGFNKYPGHHLAHLTNWWRFRVVLSRKAHFTYLKLHNELGDVVRLGPNALSFSDPNAVKAIYGLNKKLNKSDFYPVQMQLAKGEVLQSLFGTQDQDYHARLRRMVSNAFSMTSIVQYEPRVNDTVRAFLAQTEKLYATPKKTCAFKVWLQFFAFDVITEVTYSRRVGFIDRGEDVDGIVEWLDKIFDYLAPAGQMPIIDKILVKNPILILLSKYGFIDNSSGTARFSRARMQERLAELDTEKAAGNSETTDRGDLLSNFLKSQREDKSGFFNDKRVLTMTTSIALAGSDTTAVTLSAVFYHLLKNPGVLQKLMDEINDGIRTGLIEDSDIVTWHDAQKLPYLDACIQEVFRVHPAISLNLERVTPPEGLDICGNFVPGGTIVSCNPWVIHRRSEIFGEDVETYRPERWLVNPTLPLAEEQDRLREMKSTLLHFGAGSRTCLGKHIALLEVYKLVPSFLRRFDLSLTTDEEWDLRNAWFVKPHEFDVDIRLKGEKGNH